MRRLGLLSLKFRLKEGWKFTHYRDDLWIVSKGTQTRMVRLTEASRRYLEEQHVRST